MRLNHAPCLESLLTPIIPESLSTPIIPESLLTHFTQCQGPCLIKSIVSELHPMIILQNKFICFQTKAFWMLHLNDHLYTKLICLFMGSKVWCHTAGFAHLDTFTAFTAGIMSNHTNRSFTRGNVYLFLLLPNTSFLYHFIQPCDSIRLRPT